MNVLESFITEHSSSSAPASPSATHSLTHSLTHSSDDSEEEAGDLLVSGCCDWDHMTAKTAAGLEMPHRVTLPLTHACKRVRATFSSATSCHFFVLLADHSLFAMGKNDRGQLGIGSRATRLSPTLVHSTWPAERRVVKVATGKSHSLFLLDSGEVYACGAASCGQLGLGAGKRGQEDALLPVAVTALSDVRDIACGAEFSLVCTRESGQVLTFGHPEYGQLGNGQTGEFIKEGKRGMQFDYLTLPTAVRVYLTKDQRGNVVGSVPANEVKICAVAAGKNHCLCLEDWRTGDAEKPARNRLFSWGFGGYGRLGHNGAVDEMLPRELSGLSSEQPNPQRQIRQIFAGSTYSLAVSASNHTYFFGILPNSPRGEACTYPRIMQELHDYPAEHVGGGSSWVMVASRAAAAPSSDVIFWGTPAAGKFGLEGNAKSSANPKFVAAAEGMKVLSLVCGYGHCCMVVRKAEGQDEDSYRDKMQAFPEMAIEEPEVEEEKTSAPKAKGKGKATAKSKAKQAEPTVSAGSKRKKPAGASAVAKRGKK